MFSALSSRLIKPFYCLAIINFNGFTQNTCFRVRALWQFLTVRSTGKFLSIFLATVVILALASCHSRPPEQSQINSTGTQALRETRIVDHALGEVEIPVHPQRVVVLHDMLILDSVLALGVKPVGSIYWPYEGERFRGIPPELVADISTVGNISQPSIETILALKPDLILGTAFQKDYYDLLSEIAPTVFIDNLGKLHDFKERLRYIAHILGKEERAEEVLTQYQARIQRLRQQLGNKLEKTIVSVIALRGQNFYTYRSDQSLGSQVINDVGLRRPLAQENQKEPYLIWSIEMLPKHDADVLFVLSDWTEKTPELMSLLKQPIWAQLQAVQNNQVYEVNWGVGGPFGANRIIDDLFKYLIEEGGN